MTMSFDSDINLVLILRFLLHHQVATTNWKRAMIFLRDPSKYKDPLKIPRDVARMQNDFKTLDTYTNSTHVLHMWATFTKFMFVRHPYERLLSAYNNKFVQLDVDPNGQKAVSFQRYYGTRIVKRFRPNAKESSLKLGDDVTFREFILYLLDLPNRNDYFDEHWLHYDKLCHPCYFNYDFVGKYENLKRESNQLLELAGLGGKVQFPGHEPDRKQYAKTANVLQQYFSQISPQELDALEKLYDVDFKTFGYKAPDFFARKKQEEKTTTTKTTTTTNEKHPAIQIHIQICSVSSLTVFSILFILFVIIWRRRKVLKNFRFALPLSWNRSKMTKL